MIMAKIVNTYLIFIIKNCRTGVGTVMKEQKYHSSINLFILITIMIMLLLILLFDYFIDRCHTYILVMSSEHKCTICRDGFTQLPPHIKLINKKTYF
jgi:hypothetical protein